MHFKVLFIMNCSDNPLEIGFIAEVLDARVLLCPYQAVILLL